MGMRIAWDDSLCKPLDFEATPISKRRGGVTGIRRI